MGPEWNAHKREDLGKTASIVWLDIRIALLGKRAHFGRAPRFLHIRSDKRRSICASRKSTDPAVYGVRRLKARLAPLSTAQAGINAVVMASDGVVEGLSHPGDPVGHPKRACGFVEDNPEFHTSPRNGNDKGQSASSSQLGLYTRDSIPNLRRDYLEGFVRY